MNTKKDWIEGILFAGFRLMAVGLLLVGLLGMVFQLLESWYQFDPNYLGTFVSETILRPLIVFLAGLFLYAGSGLMARRMASRYHRHSS